MPIWQKSERRRAGEGRGSRHEVHLLRHMGTKTRLCVGTWRTPASCESLASVIVVSKEGSNCHEKKKTETGFCLEKKLSKEEEKKYRFDCRRGPLVIHNSLPWVSARNKPMRQHNLT